MAVENFDIEKVKFDDKGLVPCIVQDYITKRVLTLAYMNRESLGITLEKITPDRLIEAYFHIGHVPKPSDRYCQEHTVNAFCAELSELFIK